jgi:hypothetical protein
MLLDELFILTGELLFFVLFFLLNIIFVAGIIKHVLS